ncbi:hypothetical protein D3C87_637110 [compost metagenome]
MQMKLAGPYEDDGLYTLWIHMYRDSDDEARITEFCDQTGIYGQWKTYDLDAWWGSVAKRCTVVEFKNIDRNTLLMLQLGLK